MNSGVRADISRARLRDSAVDSARWPSWVVTTILVLLLVCFAENARGNPKLNERLFIDAGQGELSAVQRDIAKGADVNFHAVFGQTPLYLAAMRGHLKVVEWLADHGAKVNSPDDVGETPLEITAAYGTLDMVQFLISRGARVNIPDKWGHTPLFLAAQNNTKEVARVLLDNGAILDHEVLSASKDQEMVDFLNSYDPKVAKEVEAVKALDTLTAQREAADPVFKAEMAAGDTAVQSSEVREALPHYLAAVQRLSEQGILTRAEEALIERIIRVVSQMHPPPAIPQEAIQLAGYAQTALMEAQNDSDLSHLDGAVNELQKALEIAPWWAEGYFRLGAVLQKAHRPAEAAQSLALYLVANPHASNAQNVQMEIYKLQYETKRPQGSSHTSGQDLTTP